MLWTAGCSKVSSAHVCVLPLTQHADSQHEGFHPIGHHSRAPAGRPHRWHHFLRLSLLTLHLQSINHTQHTLSHTCVKCIITHTHTDTHTHSLSLCSAGHSPSCCWSHGSGSHRPSQQHLHSQTSQSQTLENTHTQVISGGEGGALILDCAPQCNILLLWGGDKSPHLSLYRQTKHFIALPTCNHTRCFTTTLLINTNLSYPKPSHSFLSCAHFCSTRNPHNDCMSMHTLD